MDIRKGGFLAVVIVVLFLAGTLLMSLLTLNSEQVRNDYNTTVNITTEKYGLLSYNEQNIPYITFNTNITHVNRTSISLLWFYQKPLTNVYFVTGHSVEANNMNSVKDVLHNYIKTYEGLKFATCSPSDTVNLRDSIIIISTGRMPQVIYKNMKDIIKRGNVIIYIGADIDYVIDDTGALVETHDQRSLKQTNYDWEVKKGEWNKIIVKENNTVIGYMLNIPLAPDKVSRLPTKLFTAVIYNVWQEPITQKTYTFKDSKGYLTLYGLPAKMSHGYLRTIISIISQDKSLYRIDDNEVSYPLVGRIYYDDINVLKGKPFDVSMKLRAGYLQPVTLIMSLDFIHNNYVVDSEQLATIRLKQVWKSTSTVQNNLHPGDYIVSLRDQYNNIWATGYLHVSGLYVTLNEIKNGNGVLWVTIDGEPLNGIVDMYIDDTYMGTYKVSHGFLSVKLPKGEHDIKFVYNDSDWEFKFNNASETLFDKYIKYLGTALVIFLVVYVIFRKRKPVMYKMIVPKITEKKTKNKIVRKGDIINVFNGIYHDFEWNVPLPITVREFMYGVQKYLDNNEVYITEGNAIEILNKLIHEGVVVGFEDYYMLKKDAKICNKDIKCNVRLPLI